MSVLLLNLVSQQIIKCVQLKRSQLASLLNYVVQTPCCCVSRNWIVERMAWLLTDGLIFIGNLVIFYQVFHANIAAFFKERKPVWEVLIKNKNKITKSLFIRLMLFYFVFSNPSTISAFDYNFYHQLFLPPVILLLQII